MIRLFIENNEIELNESVQFAITKQFEDLSNPTIILNDWSKTVSLPFTQKNNNIFGHIYNPDKVIVDGTGVGVYFNPLKKIDFRLTWDDTILLTGYAKLNEVKQVNGIGTYEVTLFGQLGKVFQEMQKITFDTSTTETNYLISGGDYVEEYINNSLVYKSWTSSGQSSETLYKKYLTLPNNSVVPHPYYNVTNIIGFAPNNSFSEGFDYKTYQINETETRKFEETLGDSFTSATGVEPSTAISNGLLPREIGEYRSYLQLPFVYWNKLFKIFQEKAESVTGYNFELSNSWFNSGNTYWYDLVYMLKPFNAKSEEKVTDRIKVSTSAINWGGSVVSDWTTAKSTNIYFASAGSSVVKPIIDFSNSTVLLSNDYTVLINTNYQLNLNLNNISNIRINPNNAILYYIDVVDTNSNILTTINGLMADTEYTGSTTQYDYVSKFGVSNNNMIDYPKLCIALDKGKYNVDNVRLVFRAKWLNSTEPFLYNGSPFRPNTFVGLRFNNINDNTPLDFEVIANRKRSFAHFTFNDLWNNDYNLFTEIIKYCKMFRIAITVDEIERKISFKPYKEYFSGYTITDWTDKVDKSKDYIIKPITFENKYVLFNYKDTERQLSKDYKEKYGINYGEYRLTTDYNFNSDKTDLFDGVVQSITNTDNVLSWSNLYENKKIIYSFPSEISIYNKNKDNKQVDIFGSFYFHCGLANFSTEESLNMRSVSISDDTVFQAGNSTYFYNQTNSNTTGVTTYPLLNVVKGNDMCLFNNPMENYTYNNNYSGKSNIYTSIWQTYLNERYNIQNKQITCYINIKPIEYQQFQWNKLVKVGNQLCIVNKIYDYDITANTPTKVDLITIQNISGYIS